MGAPAAPPPVRLAQLRPDPHPPAPYGNYRLVPGTSNVLRFRTDGFRAISWIESFCVYTARQYARKPFRLTDWQKQLILDLLEQSQYRVRDADGFQRVLMKRRYQWALIGIPRKNGKTEILAALALYFLLGEETSDAPVIVMAAASEKQANALFGAASKMARWSKHLKDRVTAFADEIQVRGREEAKIVRVSSSPDTTHGLNISVLIADELHVWEAGGGEDLWDTLTSAMSTGEQSLVIAISTAGTDLDTLLGREYLYCREVESGERKDPHYFFRWWQAPDGCDYKDPRAHKRANPAYGQFKSRGYMLGRADRMREHAFRRLELNQWVSGGESLLPYGAWDACTGPVVIGEEAALLKLAVATRAAAAVVALKEAPDDRERQKAVEQARIDMEVVFAAVDAGLIPGAPAYLGLDASQVSDSTAVVCVQPQVVDGEDRVRVVPFVWERPIDIRTRKPIEDWLMPFETVGKSGEKWSVTDVLWALRRWFDVRAVAYDRQFVAWEAEKLFTAGMPMISITQNGVGIEQGTQALIESVMKRRMLHDGNPTLARHVGNASARQRRPGSGIMRIDKNAKKAKMDAAMAMVMAVWIMLHPPEQPKAKAKPNILILD